MPRRKTGLPREVFISHSSRNRTFADKLAKTLRRHGVPVWYSETNIVGAQQWHDEIGKALSRCDWFVMVLSPHALKSRWVKRELLFALEDARFDGRIIPVIQRACDPKRLSWTLSSMEQIDFTQSQSEGFTNLLKIWGLGYQAK